MAVAEQTFAVMGGYGQLQIVDGPPEACAFARARLDQLEGRWSRFRPDSEVSRLNAAGGRPLLVSDDTVELVARAVDGWRRTTGRFDPTILAALVAAGYAVSYEELADIAESDVAGGLPIQAETRCGQIECDPNVGAVRLPPGVAFDPGGIGKGLAADIVAGEVIDRGAAGCLVNLGGDVRVIGRSPSPGGWEIVVEDPLDRHRDLARLRIAEGAVATTSRLARTWWRAGENRHHMIDPSTARPSDTGVMAVTAIAGEAWWAEVATKAAFLAGPNEGPANLVALGVAGLVVDDAGVRHDTPDLSRCLVP